MHGVADGVSTETMTRIRAVTNELLAIGQGTDGRTFPNEDKATGLPSSPLEASRYLVGERPRQFGLHCFQRLVVAYDQVVSAIRKRWIAHLTLGDIHELTLRAALFGVEVDFQGLRIWFENLGPPIGDVEADDGRQNG